MLVKDLFEILKGKKDYEISIDLEDFTIEVDDSNMEVILSTDDFETEDGFNNYPCKYCEGDFCDICNKDSDESWRYSNYENKDISDYDVDDHLAAWYDHMLEK